MSATPRTRQVPDSSFRPPSGSERHRWKVAAGEPGRHRSCRERRAQRPLPHRTPSTASFGEDVTTPVELVALWERIGRGEVLDHLTALVRVPDRYETVGELPDGQAVPIHVTPRSMHEPTAANRSVLEEHLGAEGVDAGITDGQWLGWRLGITADGDWQFFVSGD